MASHDALKLKINEIFHSLQGESSRAGFPTVFIRFSLCNLRCGYCDTPYAYEDGDFMSIDEIVSKVGEFGCKRVEITGGEPMFQDGVIELAERFIADGYQVMMETNGTFELSGLPDELIKIVDIKCPDSGAADTFVEANLAYIRKSDEIKFVISSVNDFEWAVEKTAEKGLLSLCTVNISPAIGEVDAEEAAQWILDSGLDFRLNLQMHKYLDIP
ncbi:MAG: radical SAM protein [Nitrospinota bacterium]|nr:radical SAM protein [Nitrospinota bacterium]